MTNTKKPLFNTLTEAIKRKEITISDLSRGAGVPVATINRFLIEGHADDEVIKKLEKASYADLIVAKQSQDSIVDNKVISTDPYVAFIGALANSTVFENSIKNLIDIKTILNSPDLPKELVGLCAGIISRSLENASNVISKTALGGDINGSNSSL